MGLVLTGWCAQRPNGHCADSGPETGVSACSSSLVLWIGASLSHLGTERKNSLTQGGLCSNKDLISIIFTQMCIVYWPSIYQRDTYKGSEEKYSCQHGC